MLKARKYGFVTGVLMGLMLLLTGCEESVETTMEFPIEILLPKDKLDVSHRASQLRVLGDPGQSEVLDCPQYVYIFVVFKSASEELVVPIFEKLELKDWDTVKYYYPQGTALTEHFYSYKHQYSLKSTLDNLTSAFVYAAVSDVPLLMKHSVSTAIVQGIPATYPTTEEAVLSVSFSVNNIDYEADPTYEAGFDIQQHIQNIYSSPYNYKPDGSTYYGTVTNILTATVPSIRLVLYHVASKVDIMWNVPVNKQSVVRVAGATVKNIYEGDCFLFKPTQNWNISTEYTSSRTVTLAGDNTGTWWNGRKSFYTIPYHRNGQFPLQVTFNVHNISPSADHTYDLTIKKTMPAVFTPWMRGTVTISDVLDANKSKIVDLDD